MNSNVRILAAALMTGVIGLMMVESVRAQSAPGSLPPAYTVSSIGTLPGGGTSQANAINSAGDVAGTALDVNNGYSDRAVLYVNGALLNLGLLGVPFPIFSEALALNDVGQVVGDTSNGAGHAFLYTGGQLHDLTTLANAIASQPFAINNNTQIVGNVAIMLDPSTVQWHSFYSDGVTMTDLTARLGGPDYSEAHGINEAGQIVGWRRVTDLDSHAFLLDGSTVTDLGTLGGANSGAQALNSIGQVVGWSYLPEPTIGPHPFLWTTGQMTDLGLLPGALNGEADAINAAGVVVGTMHFPGYSQNTRGFVYADGVLRDLNDLIAPNSGWLLKTAVGINAQGAITGTGTFNGALLGFVLHPAVMGDLNCDGVVNFADINAFILALGGQPGYQAAFPNCNWMLADVNGDGQVNFADINPFVALLSGNG